MIPISAWQAGAVMGFLTGTLVTLAVCAVVQIYFQAKRRRRSRITHFSGRL